MLNFGIILMKPSSRLTRGKSWLELTLPHYYILVEQNIAL